MARSWWRDITDDDFAVVRYKQQWFFGYVIRWDGMVITSVWPLRRSRIERSPAVRRQDRRGGVQFIMAATPTLRGALRHGWQSGHVLLGGRDSDHRHRYIDGCWQQRGHSVGWQIVVAGNTDSSGYWARGRGCATTQMGSGCVLLGDGKVDHGLTAYSTGPWGARRPVRWQDRGGGG